MFTEPETRRRTIGEYRVIEKVAEGGMCYIYMCEDRHGNPVALKQLIPILRVDSDVRRRFLREARYVLELNHPNIVRTLDVGDDGSGSYIVFEWMDGGDLEDYVRTHGAMTEAESIRLAGCVVQALQYAHAKKLLHRDIKPENIMLSHTGVPKLADFGLALPLGNPGANRITQVGQVIGSPQYMAPEQISEGNLTEATDFYGLGATMFFMVCGRPPFIGDDFHVLDSHLYDPCPSPRQFSKQELSDPFIDLIMDLLRKDPAQRPASASEIWKRLKMMSSPPPKDTSGIHFQPLTGSGVFTSPLDDSDQPAIVDTDSPRILNAESPPPTHPKGLFEVSGNASRCRRLVFLFSQENVKIGRLPETPNDIFLCLFPIKEQLKAIGRISRLHAAFTWNPAKRKWRIEDLGSRNGIIIGSDHLRNGASRDVLASMRISIPEAITLQATPLADAHSERIRKPVPSLPQSGRRSAFGCDTDLPCDGLLIRRLENAEHHQYVILQKRVILGGAYCRHGLRLPIPDLPPICVDFLLFNGYFLLRNLAVRLTVDGRDIPPGHAVILTDGMRGTLDGIPFTYTIPTWKDFQIW